MGSEKVNQANEMKASLRNARKEWLSVMQPFRSKFGVVVLPEARTLGEEHLRNCRLLPDRRDIIRRMKPDTNIMEVGVQTGNFSRFLLETLSPVELHLIDTNFEQHQVREKFSGDAATGRVVFHEGLSWNEMRALPDKHFEFIYLDADHSYEGVTKDIAVAKSKIIDDGCLIFNDYTYWSSMECIDYGVVHAVNELCLNEGWEFVYFALQSRMYCDVAIRRIR